MFSPSFSYERWIWKHKTPFYWWCLWNTENTICIYFWCLWRLLKYGNLEIFQPARSSNRIAMLFTLTYLLPECKMFSFQETDCAPNTFSLSEVCYQPAERHRNKTCIISWVCTAMPFGAVLRQYPALQGSLLLPSANSALVLSCMQRHYWSPLSEGKNSLGFLSTETTGVAYTAQKLSCLWYKIASVVFLLIHYFQDLLNSLSFRCSWGTSNLTRVFSYILLCYESNLPCWTSVIYSRDNPFCTNCPESLYIWEAGNRHVLVALHLPYFRGLY